MSEAIDEKKNVKINEFKNLKKRHNALMPSVTSFHNCL